MGSETTDYETRLLEKLDHLMWAGYSFEVLTVAAASVKEIKDGGVPSEEWRYVSQCDSVPSFDVHRLTPEAAAGVLLAGEPVALLCVAEHRTRDGSVVEEEAWIRCIVQRSLKF